MGWIISDRPYRKALSSDEALEIMTSENDKKWDKDVINALIQVVKNN